MLQFKTSKIINDFEKVQIKSDKITPLGGIFYLRELISRYVGPAIDKVLGLRCISYGYQYCEIIKFTSVEVTAWRMWRKELSNRASGRELTITTISCSFRIETITFIRKILCFSYNSSIHPNIQLLRYLMAKQ